VEPRTLGPLLNGAITPDFAPPLIPDAPGAAAAYLDEIKAAGLDPQVAFAPFGLRAWAAVHVAMSLAATLPTVNGPALLKALNAATDLDVPLFGKWTPGVKGAGGFDRIPLITGYAARWVGGKPVLLQTKPYDLSGVITQ
jgi:hypothetical protein